MPFIANSKALLFSLNQGASSVDMTRIISLNASAKCLYQQLADREFNLEDAARVLEETYHIEHEQALTDAATLVEALRQCQIIEG